MPNERGRDFAMWTDWTFPSSHLLNHLIPHLVNPENIQIESLNLVGATTRDQEWDNVVHYAQAQQEIIVMYSFQSKKPFDWW
jgi:hypothetical protein